jgi:hypothetical protein
MATENPQDLAGKRVPVVYEGLEDLPLLLANIFLVQAGDKSEYVLSFGQLAPPLILPGTPEEVREQAERLSFVRARMLARYSFTEERLREFIELLTGFMRQQDAQRQRREQTK